MKYRNFLKRIIASSVIAGTVFPVITVPAANTFAEETVESVSDDRQDTKQSSDTGTDTDNNNTDNNVVNTDDTTQNKTITQKNSVETSENTDGVTDKNTQTETEKKTENQKETFEYGGGQEASKTTSAKDTSDKSVDKNKKNGWVIKNGSYSYYKNDKAYTGWHYMTAAEGETNPHWSYFGKDGILRTGWIQFGKGTSEPDGNVEKHWSYFGSNGWLRTGWVLLGKGTSNPDGNTTKHWSYFDNNGWLKTGWVQFGKGTSNPDGNTEKHWSYFGNNGWLRTEWVQLGKGTANPDGNTAKHWSYFGPNGWMRTGWQQMGKGTKNPDCNSDFHISYFGSNGWLRTGSQTIDGANYNFSSSGWLKDTVKASFTDISGLKVAKTGDNYTLWNGSDIQKNADVYVGNAKVKTDASGIITSVDYNVRTYVNQLNYYGCYPMACGAAASFMALQANGFAYDLDGKSGWDSYIAAFRSVRGSTFGKRYGNGVMTSAQLKQCIQANPKTYNVPMTALSGSDVTLARVKDSLAHGQTVTAVVKMGNSTHWIAVTGWYKNNNKTIYKIADPWPKDGKSSTNYVSYVTQKEDAYYSDRMSASDLQSILKANSIYTYHNGGQILLTGSYR